MTSAQHPPHTHKTKNAYSHYLVFCWVIDKDPVKDIKREKVILKIKQLKDNIEKHERGLIMAIRNNTDNTTDNRMTKMGRKTTPWAF